MLKDLGTALALCLALVRRARAGRRRVWSRGPVDDDERTSLVGGPAARHGDGRGVRLSACAVRAAGQTRGRASTSMRARGPASIRTPRIVSDTRGRREAAAAPRRGGAHPRACFKVRGADDRTREHGWWRDIDVEAAVALCTSERRVPAAAAAPLGFIEAESASPRRRDAAAPICCSTASAVQMWTTPSRWPH